VGFWRVWNPLTYFFLKRERRVLEGLRKNIELQLRIFESKLQTVQTQHEQNRSFLEEILQEVKKIATR